MKESNLLYQHLGAALGRTRDLFNRQTKFSFPCSSNPSVGAYKSLLQDLHEEKLS
ncbi:hypothetical protein Sjap_015988 [Stephania japonica]|uniref:Uncharacterized protein n=1 Tax=Stephania japonica TaxID=461633 RepID=A0AAP0NUI2_9MAGN